MDNKNKKPTVKLTQWELDNKVEKLISSNITHIEWEGDEIDTCTMKEDMLGLIYELCPEYKPKDTW